jgi:hypothetical protein
MRSDSGPQIICDSPKAKSKPLKVSWACDKGAANPLVMAGKAGRYKSVVMGCMPKSKDKHKTMKPGDMALDGAAPSRVEEEDDMRFAVKNS